MVEDDRKIWENLITQRPKESLEAKVIINIVRTISQIRIQLRESRNHILRNNIILNKF